MSTQNNYFVSRKIQEIEADRRAAEKMGCAVSLKPTGPISGDMQVNIPELAESPAITGDRMVHTLPWHINLYCRFFCGVIV